MNADQWQERYGDNDSVEFEFGEVYGPFSVPDPGNQESEIYVMGEEGINALVRHFLTAAMREFGKREEVTGLPLDGLDAYDVLKQMISIETYVRLPL